MTSNVLPASGLGPGAPGLTTSNPPRGDVSKPRTAVVAWLLAAVVFGLIMYVIALTDRVSRLQRESGAAAHDSERLQQDLASVRMSLESQEAAASTSRTELQTTRAELAELRTELETAKRELRTAQAAASLADMRQREAEFRLAEKPFTVYSQVAIQNNCDEVASVALHYQPTTGSRWVTQGWWQISPGSLERLSVKLRSNAPYYYVHASTRTSTFWWKGQEVVNVPLSTDKFFASTEHPLPAAAPGYERAAFYRQPTEVVGTISLNCE